MYCDLYFQSNLYSINSCFFWEIDSLINMSTIGLERRSQLKLIIFLLKALRLLILTVSIGQFRTFVNNTLILYSDRCFSCNGWPPFFVCRQDIGWSGHPRILASRLGRYRVAHARHADVHQCAHRVVSTGCHAGAVTSTSKHNMERGEIVSFRTITNLSSFTTLWTKILCQNLYMHFPPHRTLAYCQWRNYWGAGPAVAGVGGQS